MPDNQISRYLVHLNPSLAPTPNLPQSLQLAGTAPPPRIRVTESCVRYRKRLHTNLHGEFLLTRSDVDRRPPPILVGLHVTGC